ncbi:hypothetical protein DMT56_07445 [Salmonella enterica]|nr:hypothetical protein [Salmonella enterica]EAQ6662096.1 hypothetical protein [Salmonella enterica]
MIQDAFVRLRAKQLYWQGYIPSNFFFIHVCFLLINLADISTLAVTPSQNLPLKITPQRHADGRTSEQSNHASACQFIAHKGAHAAI